MPFVLKQTRFIHTCVYTIRGLHCTDSFFFSGVGVTVHGNSDSVRITTYKRVSGCTIVLQPQDFVPLVVAAHIADGWGQ